MQHEPNATDAPAVLKISEVISVMRISRTAAYEGARNFLRTDGAYGIPCVRVGRSIRFPRLLLEQYLKQPISADQLTDPYDPTDTDPPTTTTTSRTRTSSPTNTRTTTTASSSSRLFPT
jgi:hypothetical protein